MADATKIYSGPATAIGINTTATADSGSFTDLGYMGEASVEITWEPHNSVLSSGNLFQMNGRGKAVIELLETNATGIQASLETYRTALAKLKITTLDTTNGYYYISNVFVTYQQVRPMKPGDPHKFIVTVQRDTDQPDDFCSGPKSTA
jgi:hypothetical protein